MTFLATTLLALALLQAVPPPSPPPTAEDRIAYYLALTKPAVPHQRLEALVGSWTQQGVWSVPPNPEFRFDGTAENRLILGGRFLESRVVSGQGKARIESMTLLGYDASREQYFALGVDSMGLNYIDPWGTWDEGRQSFILKGEEKDEKSVVLYSYRQVFRLEGKDRYVVETHHTSPGLPEMKVVSLVFTRVPAVPVRSK